jgi:hypothetical protein
MKIESKFRNPDMILACQEMIKMANNFFEYVGVYHDTQYRPTLFNVIKTDERSFDVTVRFRASVADYKFSINIDLDNEDETYNSFGEKYFPETEE